MIGTAAALLGVRTTDTFLSPLFGTDKIPYYCCRNSSQYENDQYIFQSEHLCALFYIVEGVLRFDFFIGIQNQTDHESEHGKHSDKAANCCANI